MVEHADVGATRGGDAEPPLLLGLDEDRADAQSTLGTSAHQALRGVERDLLALSVGLEGDRTVVHHLGDDVLVDPGREALGSAPLSRHAVDLTQTTQRRIVHLAGQLVRPLALGLTAVDLGRRNPRHPRTGADGGC